MTIVEVQLVPHAGPGRFEGLLGSVAEIVGRQPATGRCKQEEGARALHVRRQPTTVAVLLLAKKGVGAVHVRSTRGARACNVLCVCAGCVWAVRVRHSSGTHAGNGWSHVRRGRGGLKAS